MSSSLAITTSTLAIIGRITCCAAASVHSFLRKFRSTLIRAPAFLRGGHRFVGARHRVGAERRGDAGDMEPRRAVEDLRPVDGAGRHLADRGSGAVVDHHRCALAGAALGEVDADAIAAARDRVGAHAFGAQRADRRVADRILRQPRDIPAVEPELREADGDVRLAAAEGGDERRRLQQALEPGRAQAQHDLAERHDLCRHHAFPGCALRAAATLATIRRAFSVITS